MNTPRRSREFEGLAPYLKMVREHRPLSREEERALAVPAREGDVAARQKLVRHNLAVVVAVARRQRRGSVRLEDLIQEGNVGLMRAVERFDPSVGTRLSTYAVCWIRACIGKYLKEARSSVRPQSGTVAQADLSLDVAAEEGGAPYLESIPGEGATPEEQYLAAEKRRDLRRELRKVRRRIGEMGWEIVHSRLAQDQPATLEELGRQWGVSRERVRQVEMRTKHLLARQLSGIEGRSEGPLRALSA